MRKRFEFQCTISQSNKTNNFAVPYRHISSFSQSTQASSYVDSEPAISNDKVLSANTFSKSEEENQIDKFIASKLLAFEVTPSSLTFILIPPIGPQNRSFDKS